MLIALISRFLPFTVDFEFSKRSNSNDLDASAPSSPVFVKGEPDSATTLFAPTVNTPGESSKSEGSRPSSRKSHSGKGSISDFTKVTGVPTPNEAHSPVWGRTSYFNQPELRAEELPSESLVPRSIQGRPRADIGGKNSRASSAERQALKSAHWTVTYGERGNGGLANAVYSATKSGFLKDKTWVRYSVVV